MLDAGGQILVILVAVAIGVVSNWIPKPAKLPVRGVVAILVALVVVSFLLNRDDTSGRNEVQTTMQPSATSEPTVTPTEPATPSPEPAPTASSPSPTAQAPATTLLTDLEPKNEGLDVQEGSAELGEKQYLHSIVYHCDLYCDKPQGVIEYNLGGKYTWFDATAGVDNNAEEGDQVGTFEVYLDDKLIKQYTAKLGEPAAVHAKVAGGYRLKLVAARPGTTESPIEAGANAAAGISNALPHLAWGNPRVTR